jgi:hypothetical protein
MAGPFVASGKQGGAKFGSSAIAAKTPPRLSDQSARVESATGDPAGERERTFSLPDGKTQGKDSNPGPNLTCSFAVSRSATID